MGIDKLSLTEDERWLLVDLTDFGKSLFELILDIQNDKPELCASEKLKVSEKLISGLQSRDLARLHKIILKRTKPNTYEPVNKIKMTDSEIKEYISNPLNWMQKMSSGDSDVCYELLPTELGEKALDEIFKQSN